MVTEEFVGREAETRTLLANVERGRSTLVIGGPGVGKSALLARLTPELEQAGTLVSTSRVGPGFGAWLRELFAALWQHGALPALAGTGGGVHAELKAWGRLCPNNDEKARWLMDLIEKRKGVIVLIDDAHGVTPSNRPWLERLTEVATVLAAADPSALAKAGTKRLWKRFDEVRLEALSLRQAGELLDKLITLYRVVADEPEIYRRRVLELAQGNPFELTRLVKHHSAEAVVKASDLRHYSQEFVDRDVKQVALAPFVLAGGAVWIAARYIARAQGNLDLYALSGIGIALFLVMTPLLRSAIRPRSRE